MLDHIEKTVGYWMPMNKFVCMYRKLDDLGDAVDDLDSRTMDMIGNRAKELNKDLEDILRRLQQMDYLNYDKNKIDYLYDILLKSLDNEDHVELILDRLKAIENIHKESPNIDGSIKTLKNKQYLIDNTFQQEDSDINRTKIMFAEAMKVMHEQLAAVGLVKKKVFQKQAIPDQIVSQTPIVKKAPKAKVPQINISQM